MHGLMFFVIVFGGVILILAILGSTVLMALKILKGGLTKKGQQTDADETRVVQEIYQGLSRMEKRVDALETIIIDQERKERKQ